TLEGQRARGDGVDRAAVVHDIRRRAVLPLDRDRAVDPLAETGDVHLREGAEPRGLCRGGDARAEADCERGDGGDDERLAISLQKKLLSRCGTDRASAANVNAASSGR